MPSGRVSLKFFSSMAEEFLLLSIQILKYFDMSLYLLDNFSLLWENLTGREHLLFYGRLKNLKGSALKLVSQP